VPACADPARARRPFTRGRSAGSGTVDKRTLDSGAERVTVSTHPAAITNTRRGNSSVVDQLLAGIPIRVVAHCQRR
jgi:hypothetical protein